MRRHRTEHPPTAAGRRPATAPHRLTGQEWRRVLRGAARHVVHDRLMVLSAAISFFAILSIAPLLVTALSVYGAVNTPEQALDQLSDLAGVLPPELEPLVADQLTTVTAASGEVLTFRGLLGLVVALWTATTAATYLVDALTLAYHETETRSLLRRSGLGLAVVLGGAVLVAFVLVAADALSGAVDSGPGPVRALGPALTWVALGTLMAVVLAVLYRIAPDRRQARWRWISPGAGLTTVLWLATSAVLFAYVQSFGSYESTYGPLSGVAISMFWLWISLVLVILGAAVNAETERQTHHDSTVGPPRPPGQRGAVVADSVPPHPDD
jgi:membrane protein